MNFADGEQPGDDVVARAVRNETELWRSQRGPDWDDLMLRARRLPSRGLLLAVSSLVLMVILLTAVVAMTTFDAGPLAAPIPAHLP